MKRWQTSMVVSRLTTMLQVCSPDPAAISPQLEGRKLLREITDKLVTSNPGHVRAGGVEGGDGRSKETSKGGMTTAITGPASMKEFYDQMQRWSLMCGPYREIHDTMHDIAHWKGDTAKTWLFLLVSTIACLHPGWVLPSLPWVAIGFWYLRLIKRIQETALRQRRKSSTVETEGRKRDTDKDTESSKSGVYDWMQKLQDKQREVELNLQYNQTVTQQGLRMLESFRNINPREALVMSAILAIPLTIGFLLVPFNLVVLLSIYATLGYNMLSDEMAENLRRFTLHHFEGIMDRFLSRSASARQLVEIVQTVSEDSPKAQQAASAVTAKHERRSPSGETGDGALSELARSRSSGDKARVFVTYENQRWWVTGGWGHHTFAGERSAWSDEYGQFYCPKESFQLPKGPGRWEWTSLWYVDRSADGDVEGWEYAPSFSAANEDGFHSEMRRSDVVRRRRWCRRCRMVPGSDLDNPAASPSKGARQISSV
ncbi:peroxisome- protein [Perkinsus olseni]|uniref:Peroxisome- protein n=1 Tax=Perkinsus olseni TaxID=32597 RepID=A0A7J6TQY5_PEROL|nr:peroxisome- protein [Perkinsus olseni]